MNEIEILRHKIEGIKFPKSLVKKTNGEIEGLGFFPGANGLMGPSLNISDRKYMILGQDQDTIEGFELSIKKRHETYSKTWSNLTSLFNEVPISIEDCFFTNCILGVRVNSKSNTGKSPAVLNSKFLKRCLDFLRFQIDLQKPNAIICLGLNPIRMLSYLSNNLQLKFLMIDSFTEMDSNNLSVIPNTKFNRIKSYSTTILVLTHPSYRTLNVKNRSYQGLKGHTAEIAMLRLII